MTNTQIRNVLSKALEESKSYNLEYYKSNGFTFERRVPCVDADLLKAKIQTIIYMLEEEND